jgi:hypothetical protein
MKPGVAVAEKRTKANSQNVGVAARHDLFIKKARTNRLGIRLEKTWRNLTTG